MWTLITKEMAEDLENNLPLLEKVVASQSKMNAWYEEKYNPQYLADIIINKADLGLQAWIYEADGIFMTLVLKMSGDNLRILTASCSEFSDEAVTIWQDKLKELIPTYEVDNAFAFILNVNYPLGEQFFGALTDDAKAKARGFDRVEREELEGSHYKVVFYL